MPANAPPRAPGELAEIEAIIRRHVWARYVAAFDKPQILGIGAAAAEIAALRASGDGGEAMRRPIAEYPRKFVGHCEDPEDRSAGDYWGPDAVLFVPAQDGFYRFHEVSYVGHLEAGMWLVRDAQDPCCWAEIPVPPSHFILMPPKDEANRIVLSSPTKIEGTDEP